MINTEELRERLKVSSDEFAAMIGMTRQTLWNKERGLTPWTLPELIQANEIMKQNGIEEHLTVSHDGDLYIVCIKKIIEE